MSYCIEKLIAINEACTANPCNESSFERAIREHGEMIQRYSERIFWSCDYSQAYKSEKELNAEADKTREELYFELDLTNAALDSAVDEIRELTKAEEKMNAKVRQLHAEISELKNTVDRRNAEIDTQRRVYLAVKDQLELTITKLIDK